MTICQCCGEEFGFSKWAADDCLCSRCAEDLGLCRDGSEPSFEDQDEEDENEP